jgi:hypothetical protein
MQFGCVARKIHGDDQEKVNNDMYDFVKKHFQSQDGFTPKEFFYQSISSNEKERFGRSKR